MARLLAKLYLSPLGRLMSAAVRPLAEIHKPRMLYGAIDPASGEFRKHTRISSSVVVLNKNRMQLGDSVWVWHHSILDATEGISIGKGAQIGAWVGVFTHGSERAIRIHGCDYIRVPAEARKGYTRGPVRIGEFTFVGAGAIILPGVTVGKGALIGAGAVVSRSVPDRAIVMGAPGKVIGDTADLDLELLREHGFPESYYDPGLLERLRSEALQCGKPPCDE